MKNNYTYLRVYTIKGLIILKNYNIYRIKWMLIKYKPIYLFTNDKQKKYYKSYIHSINLFIQFLLFFFF